MIKSSSASFLGTSSKGGQTANRLPSPDFCLPTPAPTQNPYTANTYFSIA